VFLEKGREEGFGPAMQLGGADMSRVTATETNDAGHYVLTAAPPTRSGLPFADRRKSDRRKSDRRQQAGSSASKAKPAGGELNPQKIARLCTARERQVLSLLVQGMTNKEIAQELGIAEDTVKKHLQHAYRKLDVHRRALLMIGVRSR